ncbi:MAG TPA: gamma-glutamyltransferase [Noviherbaspirillum sp.]|nr:gamma-glutamyltransferase [Noviherbaspirillum sp.]
MSRRTSLLSSLAIPVLLAACAGAPVQQEPGMQAPERATGLTEQRGATAQNFMVAAANPLATQAGQRILQAGGSALDAAIAVQMVLTLVEPQSSGIGGGAFLLHTDGKRVQAYDGRETAPARVDENLFRGPDGKALAFHDAVVGGRSVGVPGVLRMLERAHREHGRLQWAALFAPAIALADEGFPVSQRLHTMLKSEQHLKKDPTAAAYFYDGAGEPHPVGYRLRNPELAQVLREIASGGADAFYTGRLAKEIEAKVQGHPGNPGALSAADIAGYQAREREPICTDYRRWTVCGMPPPSSGGIAVAQMLGMLETRDMAALRPVDGVPSAEAIHLFSEAGRLAYADRGRYVADSDFVPLPGNSPAALLDARYLQMRARLIGERSMGKAEPGTPPATALALGTDRSPELPSTSHVSIVDAYGNALSMTTTIEDAFGSRQMVRGFLLNNQLTDFSFEAADAQGPIANRVEPGKRPRSSMAPTLVFERGTRELVLSAGSPGGSAIINYVAKVLVGTLDWELNVQDAISLPNFGSRNGPTEVEQGRVPEAVIESLRARGHNVRVMEQTSGLQGIMRISREGRAAWFGGADPRREGAVMGD